MPAVDAPKVPAAERAAVAKRAQEVGTRLRV